MIEIPGYRIIRRLGSGGMSMVYLAEHGKLGHRVAIKVLSDVLTADETVRKRFLQEARVMASLRHKGIVPVNDFIETKNTLAIVMEYIEGRNLSDIIGREIGPIPFERALELFRQILEATEYAHDRGVIHRDLKPSNVMVTPDGTTKVMDFGIAKITGSAGHTRTGTKLGTLYYMSPEQIRGARDVDKRADIYSLGMTLYEMLAGRLPFDTGDETSEWEISQKIVLEDYEPPSRYYPHIPEWLVGVVQKATAKKPDDRYGSCEEFLEAMDEEKEDNTKPIEKDEDSENRALGESTPTELEEEPKRAESAETEHSTSSSKLEKLHSFDLSEDKDEKHHDAGSSSELKDWMKIAIPFVIISIALVVFFILSSNSSNGPIAGMDFVIKQ